MHKIIDLSSATMSNRLAVMVYTNRGEEDVSDVINIVKEY